MKTFFNILQTIIDIKEKNYPDEPFNLLYQSNDYNQVKSHISCLIANIFYAEQKIVFPCCQYKKNAIAKLSSLNYILDNSFYQKELKEDLVNIFSKAQKHYYAFSKLARIYKINKYPFVVTDDLSMNALDPKHKNTFLLLDNKTKYLFSLNDLISIIETAIGNAPEFFSEPLVPLNPYNKQPISISTLYNIYFKMKESGRLISVLFHFFFLENFDKINFSEHYEHYIRENSIKKFIFNSPYTILYPYVFYMLDSNPYTQQYNIHPDFPKETLVDIFRPYLFYYFIVNYDIRGTNKIYSYKEVLFNKLKKFYRHNKLFGRRYIQITHNCGNVIKKEYKFNSNHITFYGIPFTNFNTPIRNIVFNNTILNSNNTIITYIYDSNATIGDELNTQNIYFNNQIINSNNNDNNDNNDNDDNSDNNDDDNTIEQQDYSDNEESDSVS